MARGRVFKRGETWSYMVDVGKDLDGRRKQRLKGGFKTRREAERALRETLAALDTGSYVDPNSETVAGYLRDRWLPAVQPPRLAPSTWAGYRWELERRVIPRVGMLKLQELTAPQLDALYSTLLREGGARGQGLSQKSVRYVHGILHRALADAVHWGLLARNVADRASPPTQQAIERERREMKTWTAAELRAFLDHVHGDRLYVGWLLAATTGMRRGEVLGLRWQDVDLDAARLAVRQTLVMVEGKRPEMSRPKTQRSRRTIDLDEDVVAALRSWRTRQAQDRLRWGELWQDLGLVLTREDGSWVAPHGWTVAFDRHVTAAGLSRIRLHDLRHTHATLLLADGESPKVVSERLGHTSTAFTLDVYAHVTPGMQADAARRFSRIVSGRLRPR